MVRGVVIATSVEGEALSLGAFLARRAMAKDRMVVDAGRPCAPSQHYLSAATFYCST